MMITVALLRATPDDAQEMLERIAEEKGLDYAQRVAEMAFPYTTKKPQASHLNKAEELFHAGRLPEALDEYKLAIAMNRDDATAYMGAGDCYYRLGQHNLATAFFEESVSIKAAPSTLLFLGDAHGQAGRFEKAVSAYEQAVELDPSYTLAREHLLVPKKHMEESHV